MLDSVHTGCQLLIPTKPDEGKFLWRAASVVVDSCGEMKGQVLPEELQCLGTQRDCGWAANRAVKTDWVKKESKGPCWNCSAVFHRLMIPSRLNCI